MVIPAGPGGGVEIGSGGGLWGPGPVRLIATPGPATDAPDEVDRSNEAGSDGSGGTW